MARLSTFDLDHVHRALRSRGIVVGSVETASDGRRLFRRKAISIPDRTFRAAGVFFGVPALGIRLLFAAKTGRVPRWARRIIDSD